MAAMVNVAILSVLLFSLQAVVEAGGLRKLQQSSNSIYCTPGVNYAFAAYCSGDEIKSWDCTPYCNNVPKLTVTLYDSNPTLGVAAYVGYNAALHLIVVSFRGSYNVQNAVQDIDAPLVAFNVKGTVYTAAPGGQTPVLVHQGFLADYMNFQPDINNALSAILFGAGSTSATCKGCLVTVTGHSLGGAMANLAAYDLAAQKKYGNIVSYTYGSPRTGNGAFVDGYKQLVTVHYRNVHRYDSVPHVPPQTNSFPDDYWHTDTEVWQQPSGTYEVCSSDNIGDSVGNHEESSCSDSLTVQALIATDHLTYCGVNIDPTTCGGSPISV